MEQGGYDIVLFDLGGVLVRLGGVHQMQELSGIDDEGEIWRRWLSCPWVRSFERGRCSPEEFAAGVVGDWGLDVTADSFLERFRAWPEAVYGGAVELVREVAGRCRVGCLSNTNELHWADQSSRWAFADLFEVVFLSYRLDMVKPDREIFDHVVAALEVAPARILFLDDNAVNVDQARAAGWAGAMVSGADEARSALVELAVLPGRAEAAGAGLDGRHP
jgi:putative hydrolase of the HAD superfamily